MNKKTIRINITYETDVPIDEWTDSVMHSIKEKLKECVYAPRKDTLKIEWERTDIKK